jgi:hypothetical protein
MLREVQPLHFSSDDGENVAATADKQLGCGAGGALLMAGVLRNRVDAAGDRVLLWRGETREYGWVEERVVEGEDVTEAE